METIVIPAINMAVIAPEVILSLFAMALLLINVFVKGESKAYLGYLSIAGIVVSLFYTAYQAGAARLRLSAARSSRIILLSSSRGSS